MIQNAEKEIRSRINNLEIVLAHCDDSEKGKTELQIQCYRESLILLRKQMVDGAVVSQIDHSRWKVTLGGTIYFVRKISVDCMKPGYECYLQNPDNPDYYKLLNEHFIGDLSDAVTFIYDKYKEGV